MKRITSTDAVGVLPAVSESGTVGYFTNGDPGVPTPATTVTAEFLNRVQEEIAGVIEGAGDTLDGADNTQLYTAILALINNAGSNRPPVRQTVLSAANSSGVPNFISIGSGLSVNIAATTTPVRLTAANGFNAAGQLDRVGTISADTTISSLTDATTNYLYADIASDGSVTLGKTTLAPTYQWGGSYSTTNGQFVFNIQEMVGKVGNGSAAVQTYRVFIGEAVTSGGVVTSVVNYALMGRYQSADVSMTAPGATLYSFSHNIGVRDVKAAPLLRCTTGEFNYSVGDVVEMTTYATADDSAQPTVRRSSRNSCEFRSGPAGTNGLLIINATTAAQAEPTAASWSVFMQAERGW